MKFFEEALNFGGDNIKNLHMSDPEPRGVIIWQNMRRGRLKASKFGGEHITKPILIHLLIRWEERNGSEH